MKKLALFLVLFAAGLGALRYFQGAGPGGQANGQGTATPPWAREGDGGMTGLTPRGALHVKQFLPADAGGRRPTDFVLDAADSGAGEDGSSLYFTGVELSYRDPDTGAERMRLRAAHAIADRVADAVGFEPRLEREVRLFDVEATVFDGAPVVPLTIRVPELLADLEARTLTSDGVVTIEGPGLQGGGTGLLVDEPGQFLRLDQDGSLQLDGYAGAGGTIGAQGPLEVYRPSAADPTALEVRALGDARLTPLPSAGADPAVVVRDGLWADEIVLTGRDDAQLGIALQAIDAWRAEGSPNDVRYQQGEQVLRGGRAHVDLDAEGEPILARLTQDPRATLVVDPQALGAILPAGDGGQASGAGGTAPRAGTLDLTSDGALEVRWIGDAVDFSADGPAVFHTSGIDLYSTGPATGRLGPADAEAVFRCTGGVRLEAKAAVLVTQTLDARLTTDADGTAVMHVTANGRPLITGTSNDGREFVLAAEGALEFERRGEAWSVPRAERVELTVLGDDGLHARANLVEDFVPADLSLLASGSVVIETPEGVAHGHSLHVESRERFTLHGLGEQRATFESAEGTASAFMLVRDGERVTLRGAVLAHLEPRAGSGEVYDLDCDALTVQREEAVDGARTIVAFHVDADGVRDASVRGGEDGLDLICATLAGSYREVLDGALSPIERFSSFNATGVERAVIRRGGQKPLLTRLSSTELGATRLVRFEGATIASEEAEAVARGNVLFHGSAGNLPFSGTASEVRVDRAGTLFARAADDGKVFVSGSLPSNGKPYELEARTIRATPDRLEATAPEIVVLAMQDGTAGEGDIDIHARAQRLVSTRQWLELEGEVHVDGVTEELMPWQLDAGLARFEGKLEPGEGVKREDIMALTASRGVRLSLPGRDLVATGETLRARRLSGIMRFEGVPARINEPPMVYESDWIEFDVDLGMVVGSGESKFGRQPEEDSTQEQGAAEEGDVPTVEFASLSTLFEPDALIVVLEEPRITSRGDLSLFLPLLSDGEVTVRASWAVLWIDRHELDALKQGEAELPGEEVVRDDRANLTRMFSKLRQFGVVNEVYLEGPVELSIEGQPTATASAVYLDIVSGNGWLADATFTISPDPTDPDATTIKVKARWLRQSKDNSFFADEAKVSLCAFDDPHLEITTGDLRITPNPSNPEHYDVLLRDNRVEVYDLFVLPLPSIDWTTDEEGRPVLATLKLGSSARFGSFVSAGIVRPASGAAKFLHGLVGRGDFDVDVNVDAQYSLDASWLGSRGVLLDGGFLAEADGEYKWVASLGGIPDGDEDKGFIRVDEDDRDTLRLWARTHGRYWIENGEWIDFAASTQTDAGVQSEFFESEFTSYEQTESYVSWRKAYDEWLVSARASFHIDDYQSRVDELPALRAWRGRSEVLSLGPASLVYAGSAEAAYLSREESDGGYASPYGQPAVFPDGLGDRDALRLDTTHRFEAPIPLGVAGLRATPFALARLTAWSEDDTGDDSPTRAFGQLGLRVATTFWKRAKNGGVHQLVPYVSARKDVVLEENGGDPVPFDDVENSLEGQMLDLGVRGRVAARGGRSLLDVDVRATHVSDVPVGIATGWTELGVFSRLNILPFDVPVQVSHDGRYDVDNGDTLYSRLAIGFRPTRALGVEAAHHRGTDLDRETLYEAASIRGLYTWTEKWEFEGRQTYSLIDNGDRLGSAVILRRYGHDIVFEVESSFREGEGASLGISIRPLFTFNRPDVGDVSF